MEKESLLEEIVRKIFLFHMIYLIGVNHGVQFLKDAYSEEQLGVVKKFGDFVRQQVVKYDIEMIAEEMSTEALATHQAKSFTKNIAENLKIAHLFCDPTTEEKKELGIVSDEDREKEWLRRIVECRKERTLFICGHDHLNSFKSLLQCQIITDEYFGKELDPHEQMKELMKQK